MVSVTNQLKLLAPDGKRRLTDVLDYDGVVLLAKSFPNTRASRYVEWFTNSDETIDGKSKSKAYALFESNLIDNIEVGTVKGLQRCVDWSKINKNDYLQASTTHTTTSRRINSISKPFSIQSSIFVSGICCTYWSILLQD